MKHLPEWTHGAVLLSRDSGLRIGEVCGVPWHRVDLLHKRVTVSDVVLVDGTTPAGHPEGWGGAHGAAQPAHGGRVA